LPLSSFAFCAKAHNTCTERKEEERRGEERRDRVKLPATLAQLRVSCRGEERRGEERRDRVKLPTILVQLRVPFAQRGEERRDRVKSDPIQTRGSGSRRRS